MNTQIKPNTIRGDIAKHSGGTIGTVRLVNSNVEHKGVVIKRIISSYTDEYLDDYYVIDLPGRPDCWVMGNEFFADKE